MQRKRDGLVPVQKIRGASPQALHHFTQADQVDQLVGASEGVAELGFMARLAKQLFFCNLTESDLRSDSPVV